MYDDYEGVPDIDISPSSLSTSNYRRWLKKIDREETVQVKPGDRLSSFVGTAFHERASKALESSDDFKGYSEYEVRGEIAGYTVGGTIDVVYHHKNTYIIGDFKTMGAYQFKVASRADFKSYIPQLSIYSFLYAQNMGIPYSRLGELYIVVTGDAGYFRKDEGGGKTPKYVTETIELLSPFRVMLLIARKMKAIETEPEIDCEDWMCNWCSYNCEFRIDQSSRKTGNK
jgi:hypothetical protein